MTVKHEPNTQAQGSFLHKTRLPFSVLFAFLLALTTVTPANATYYSGGLISTSFGVYYQPTLNSTWVTLFNEARGAWNKAGVKADIYVSSLKTKKMEGGRYTQSWYGLYSATGARNATRNFTIKVNARTIEADSTAMWRGNWIRGTTVHELGHALSLADEPPKSPSIMRYDRNRDLLISPTQYDKDEVKRIYKK